MTAAENMNTARERLGEARFTLGSPHPDELTSSQSGELAYIAAHHQQAALEAILEHLGGGATAPGATP